MNRVLIGLAIGSAVLAATNPSHEDFANYASQTMQAQCQTRSLPMPEKLACDAFSAAPQSWKNNIIQSYSQRRSYLFFSVYSLNVGSIHSRCIGIGGQFFPQEILRGIPPFRNALEQVESPKNT